MTHPGVGPVTALATEVFLGDPLRFVDGKAVASYIGLIPSERSSGGRQRLGKLSKEGNALVRYLWGEATIHAVRRDPELKRFYRRKLMRKDWGKQRSPPLANSGSDSGSCCAIRLTTRNSAAADSCGRKSGDARAGMPGHRWSCSAVTGVLNGLPASLIAGSLNKSSWSIVTAEMFGGATPNQWSDTGPSEVGWT